MSTYLQHDNEEKLERENQWHQKFKHIETLISNTLPNTANSSSTPPPTQIIQPDLTTPSTSTDIIPSVNPPVTGNA